MYSISSRFLNRTIYWVEEKFVDLDMELISTSQITNHHFKSMLP